MAKDINGNEYLSCWNCGADLGIHVNSHISRTEICEKCHASIHCCRMCEFFEKDAYNQCRETQAERITEKDKANFCGYFKQGKTQKAKESAKEAAIDIANSLFKN